MKSVAFAAVLSLSLGLSAAPVVAEEAPRWSLAIHGGAGVIERDSLTPQQDAAYRAALQRALDAGSAVLRSGGAAMDAVQAAIQVMEDDPLFNAGRGAVFTAEGRNELDAAVMDGTDLTAGAVAGLTATRHPIAAARAVMEHLYGLGHERIAVVGGPPDNPLHQQRLEGVRAAGKARGRLRQLSIVPGDFSVESGHAAVMALLDGTPVPTAVFCFSDQMALGALAACRDRGIRVPEALSIVGFDDLASSRYLTPPLTTIRQPMREIGERAVNLLLAIIEQVDVPLQQTLEFSLMVRGSTAAPRRG